MKPKKQVPARINPDPRFVWLLNFALDSVTAKLATPFYQTEPYLGWFDWAKTWKDGERSPQACVDIARGCFVDKENPVLHTLGQLAWAAKECCYGEKTSGWLVIRYIADAMIAFGVAFPDNFPKLLDSPSLESLPSQEQPQLFER